MDAQRIQKLEAALKQWEKFGQQSLKRADVPAIGKVYIKKLLKQTAEALA